MEIKSLSNVSLKEITDTFNAAFADYKIKFQLTEEAMTTKMKSENIQLEYSAGVFDEARLVGFILTGTDVINNEKVAYNAGTGVIPAYRGQGISKQLYKYLITQLQQHG